MPAMSGEYVWNVLSTPSPLDTLRTTNDELRPRLRLAMTTPSYACTRLRSPSTTLTLTMTVSPGENAGIVLLRRAISSRSRVSMMFMLRFLSLLSLDQRFARRGREPALFDVSGAAAIFVAHLRQQLPLFLRQRPAVQQVGPPLPCPAQRLLEAPAA